MKLNVEEALRYLGVPNPAPDELRQQAERVAAQLTTMLPPRHVYRICTLEHEQDGIRLKEADILLTGRSAGRMLESCDQAALLACTLGVGFDTMLRTAQARDMSQAVLLDACGSAWVEAGCDAVEEALKDRFPMRYFTDRFSPGYGDLPLDLQPAICAALDASRRLGLHVTDSFLLNPMKSVTAIIGISDRPQMARIRGCDYCTMRARCSLRKRGIHCGT